MSDKAYKVSVKALWLDVAVAIEPRIGAILEDGTPVFLSTQSWLKDTVKRLKTEDLTTTINDDLVVIKDQMCWAPRSEAKLRIAGLGNSVLVPDPLLWLVAAERHHGSIYRSNCNYEEEHKRRLAVTAPPILSERRHGKFSRKDLSTEELLTVLMAQQDQIETLLERVERLEREVNDLT